VKSSLLENFALMGYHIIRRNLRQYSVSKAWVALGAGFKSFHSYIIVLAVFPCIIRLLDLHIMRCGHLKTDLLCLQVCAPMSRCLFRSSEL